MEETGQPPAFDEDPAAAFLAKEQSDLAGIVDDTLGFGTEVSEDHNHFLGVVAIAISPGRRCGSSYRRGHPSRRRRNVRNGTGEHYLKQPELYCYCIIS